MANKLLVSVSHFVEKDKDPVNLSDIAVQVEAGVADAEYPGGLATIDVAMPTGDIRVHFDAEDLLRALTRAMLNRNEL